MRQMAVKCGSSLVICFKALSMKPLGCRSTWSGSLAHAKEPTLLPALFLLIKAWCSMKESKGVAVLWIPLPSVGRRRPVQLS